MTNKISLYIVIFFVYSFLGWCAEVVFCSIGKKVAVNRGFVYGPLCPIYGFGALLIIFVISKIPNKNWLVVFSYGVIFSTALEYLTSYIMEKLFGLLWWDYSHYLFNINGRVCLLNSFLFGLMAVIVDFFVHNKIMFFINKLSAVSLNIIAIALSIFYIFDLLLTFYTVKRYKVIHNAKRSKFKLLDEVACWHFSNSFPYTKKEQ